MFGQPNADFFYFNTKFSGQAPIKANSGLPGQVTLICRHIRMIADEFIAFHTQLQVQPVIKSNAAHQSTQFMVPILTPPDYLQD
jgi:hypothetical protein